MSNYAGEKSGPEDLLTQLLTVPELCPHEVYVRPFPKGDGRWQVSTSGGSFPRWRGDGKELFYLMENPTGKVMAAAVNGTGSRFEAATPTELFDGGNDGALSAGHQGNYLVYAVSPDGQRFLMPRTISSANGSAPESPTINVILNWTSLLKK